MGFVSFGKGVSGNNNTFAKDLIEKNINKYYNT